MNLVLRHTRKECAMNLCVLVSYLKQLKGMTPSSSKSGITLSFTDDDPLVVTMSSGKDVMDDFLVEWLKQEEMEEEALWKETMNTLWDSELLEKDVFFRGYQEELRHYRRVMLVEKCRSKSIQAEEIVKRLSTPVLGLEFLEDPVLSLSAWMDIIYKYLDNIQQMKIFRACDKKEWMKMMQPTMAVDPLCLNTPEDWRRKVTSYLDVDRFLLSMDAETCLSSVYDVTIYQHENHPRLALMCMNTDGWVRRAHMVTHEDICRHAARDEYRGYHPSSASMAVLSNEEEMLILQRSVNYTIIHENGAYIYDGQVKTQNYWIRGSEWKPLVVPESFSLRKGYILGMEDMRVFACPSRYPDRLYAMATTVEYGASQHSPCQVLCVLNKEYELLQVLDIDYHGGRCQKNWCPYFTTDGRLMLIYGWHPFLTLIEVMIDTNGNPILKDKESQPPKVDYRVCTIPFSTECKRLDSMRGSTSPIYVPETDEWYLMVHEVYHIPNVPTRRYRHRVIRLPGPLLNTLVMPENRKVRIGVPVVMEDNQIEYTLGLALKNHTVYLHYSVWDNSSNMIEVAQGAWLTWFHENSTDV